MDDFWLEYKKQLRGYIAKRVREQDAVDDILQDVLIKAHANLHTVASSGSIAAWLYRIAANAIADHYRAHRTFDELPDELPAPEAEPDYIADLASCFQPLIDDLPETYRAALVLSEIDGLTQKEVASRLGLTLSGAKSRVQRGREKLRRNLHECCDIETGTNGIVGFELRDPKRGCRRR